MTKGIIFANPPAKRREGQQRRGMLPLPLIALANSLDDGVLVEHISPDLLTDYGQAATIIGKSDAEWLAITCYQETMQTVLDLARIAKQAQKKVVIGGHHITIWGGNSVLQEIPEVDYVVVGEGELPLKLLVEDNDPQQIPNLWWRQKGVPTTNNLPMYVNQWTHLPPMIRGYAAFNYSNLWERTKRIGRSGYEKPFSVIGVRGCAYAQRNNGRCNICAMPLNVRLRCREPQQFWKEIEWAVQQYNVDLVWEHSDSFLGLSKWLARLADVRPTRKMPPIWCYGRADEINTENIESISKIGVEHIYIGVEAGSDERIQAVNKGITLDQVLRAIRLCCQHNIRVQPSFLFGLPGETRESVKDTINLAIACRDEGVNDVVFHEFILRKGLLWFDNLVSIYPEFNRVVLSQGEIQELLWQYFNPEVKRTEVLAMMEDVLGKFPHSELTAWDI